MLDAAAPEVIGVLAAAPFVGSFLGTLILRWPAGEPVAVARSACPHCRHPLGPLELVPLASWIVQRGRCRHCRAALGAFYPAIELAALAVAAWAAGVASGVVLVASCILGWCLLAAAAIDQRHFLLPDALTLPLIPLGLATAWLIEPAELPDHAIGAAAGFIAFALVAVAYRRLRGRDGLGLGDAKLLAAAGAWVAWTGLPSVVLIAAASALLLTLGLALAGRRLTAADRIPFGPHLCLGCWLVWLYGPLALG